MSARMAYKLTKCPAATRADDGLFSEVNANVVDISRAPGSSRTTIYRRFRLTTEVFDAIVAAEMWGDEEIARAFVETDRPAPKRLTGMALALNRRKA